VIAWKDLLIIAPYVSIGYRIVAEFMAEIFGVVK
jgi:hypothetical protein